MMEKLSRMKDKFFKFLPKQPMASLAIQNPNLSPSGSVTPPRGGRSPTHRVSIIPKEARRRHGIGSFSEPEPTSPRVSCMGQVKCKKKKKAHKHEKKENFVVRIFKGGAEDPKQSGKAPITLVSPSLGSMKKFESGRGSLSDFHFMER